jgi:hypothetical protein
VGTIAISEDNKYIATLSYVDAFSVGKVGQTFNIWDLHSSSNDPIASTSDILKDIQTFCVFNSNTTSKNEIEIATNGKERVLFWLWEEGSSDFDFYAPGVMKEYYKKIGDFTQTAFIPETYSPCLLYFNSLT